jgi:parallel beta-helix repeat protein
MKSLRVALGFVIATTAVFAAARPAASATIKVVNVKAFGAKGDGVTNDTAAINLAIFRAEQEKDPNTLVYFDPGTYLYTNTLEFSGVTMTGAGATLLASAADVNVDLRGSQTVLFGLSLASKVRSLGTTAVTVGATDAKVTNCTFQDNFGNGIFVGSSARVSVTNNVFSITQGSTQSAIRVGGCSDCKFQLNKMVGTSQGGTGMSIATSSGITLSNNTVANLERGITVSNCQNVAVTFNTISNCHNGLALNVSPKSNASENSIGGSMSTVGVAIQCNLSPDSVISKNSIADQLDGILPNNSDNARITENSISDTTDSIYATNCKNMECTHNTLSGGTLGIGFLTGYGTLTQNNITGMANQGIYVTGMTPSVRISSNALKDCGLVAVDPKAVIYQNSPSASSIVITDNTYEGNAAHLQYFIWDVQRTPPSVVSGNQTNTALPNRIGS